MSQEKNARPAPSGKTPPEEARQTAPEEVRQTSPAKKGDKPLTPGQQRRRQHAGDR